MLLPPVPLSLYLHIPFCTIKCSYCAFNTYIHLESLIEPFIAALVREIEIVGNSQPHQPVGTIYIGGGTPSLLTPAQIAQILEAIHKHFDVLPGAEISMESNPSDIHRDYMAALRGLGINRLSIGMQTANANELELFGRRHDNDAVVRAVSAARAGGFDNLNLDLIYGFPHQTLETWEMSLKQMLALQPEHISLYALGVEDGTAMKAWIASGRLPTPDDDLAADMYDLATDTLAASGYDQYEISNWSKVGYECRHNLQYWRNLPYPGFGPGAHGYANGVRYATLLSPHRYIKSLTDANEDYAFPRTPAVDQWNVVDREGEIADTLLMGLRLTREGISRPVFKQRFGEDLLDIHGPLVQRYENYGLLYVDESVVRLTQKGRLLSNMIFRELV
ncbi:MAG: radical SAM family heme chaperone HemW [Chloroflexota bacterium]